MENAKATGRYTAECYDKDGNLLWRDEIKNLVTTAGKNFALNTLFEGSSYSATWFLGLISSTGYTTGPAAGDTMSSHPGWTEDVSYSQSTRLAPTWDAAASGSKATQTVSFSINASATIKGLFMVTHSAKSGVLGTLYSAGLFSGGDKTMSDGQLLNVTWTGGM